MHDDVFFKECFDCERQYNYSIKGVKDNCYKCRIRKIVIEKIYNGIKICPYFKRRDNNG